MGFRVNPEFRKYGRSILLSDRWYVALRSRRKGLVSDADMSGFTLLPCPRGRMFADPSLVQLNDRVYLFCESYDFLQRRGSVLCCECDRLGQPICAAIVLKERYHLSYPHVFSYQDRWYLLPEAAGSGAVQLYQADSFPWSWSKSCILLDEPLLDPTVLSMNGRWYVFGTPYQHLQLTRTYDRLAIFSSPELTGPYKAIKGSPFFLGTERGRMGGAFIEEGGVILRVAQNCRQWYGHSIGFWRVIRLDETGYEEELVRMIGPEWWPQSGCIHTYNRTADWEAVDLSFLEFSPFLSTLRIMGAARSCFVSMFVSNELRIEV